MPLIAVAGVWCCGGGWWSKMLCAPPLSDWSPPLSFLPINPAQGVDGGQPLRRRRVREAAALAAADIEER